MNNFFRAYLSRRQPTHTRLLVLTVLVAPLLLLPLTLGACADPAADAPDAVVSDVQVDTSDTTAADTTDGGMRSYSIDPAGSAIGFVGSKVTGSHDGGFGTFEGTISMTPGDPTQSRVAVTIDTTSLWSDNEKLTGHLKSEDFFAVDEYPSATFTSTEIVATDSGYEIVGNLDLRGVEKQIRFPASITVTDTAITANAEFSIRRFDFGIQYPGRADDLIRDEVLVRLDLTATTEA